MGNSKSGAMSKEILEDLKLNTKFSESELVQWYENFKKQCPSGRISKEEFQNIYTKFSRVRRQHLRPARVPIIALHMTSTGKTTRKLEWAFSLFDVDKNGYITKSEVKEICHFQADSKEDLSTLPEDENTPEKRADKLWKIFNKEDNDRVAEGEFIQGVLDNDDALRLIQYQPQK
uniref:Recoverin n=1 Tax=Sphaeramia orbicularis TaxID=375764 RepID=A0A673AZS2_9TELE